MEEKKKTGLFARLNQRRFRYGRFAAFLTIAVFATVILLNVAVGRLEQTHAWAVNVNGLNATEFDQATLDVLKLVDQDVNIYTVYQTSAESALRVQVDAVLEKYHALNRHIHIANIDPVTEPGRMAQLAGDMSGRTASRIFIRMMTNILLTLSPYLIITSARPRLPSSCGVP